MKQTDFIKNFDRAVSHGRPLKQIEDEARAYYYASSRPQQTLQSHKMAKLRKEWEAAGGLETGYNFGDVLA